MGFDGRVTIHSEHPFASSPDERDPARRLRGRLGGRVSLLTAGEGRRREGLTLTSCVLVPGEPWRLVAFVDPDCNLAERLHQTGRGVWQLLDSRHRYLADVMAGLAPSPGGAFGRDEWLQTPSGPLLAGVANHAELELEDSSLLGWMEQFTFVVTNPCAGEDPEPVFHIRGSYRVFPA